MSQPDHQSESTRDATGRRDDLIGPPFPSGDWAEPCSRLDALYRRTERDALRTVDWYLADRVRKRRAARALRAGAGTAGALGVLLPLLELAGAGDLLGWGYLALLAAALCLGADRLFGLTSGWMRDMATAQAVQRRLEELRYDWASETAREALGPSDSTPTEAAERCLAMLRRFSDDIAELVRSETALWMIDFRADGGQLLAHTGPARARPAEPPAQPRRVPQAAARPAMPRQRPPEGPR
ncbi:SLATT domain-containing protein [Streptomyces sp. SM12]|uniref:SLATT domain-containing protein n=1 Tax=Streptomyces sp. SM12 TaxID=1071602 RepID=UPI000CD4ABC2|nr:SLATT domain-containing protein [Streptomyces sp. SM12]